MNSVLPIVLWYGGLIGVALAALLVLWALALIAIKQSTDRFAAAVLLGGLVLAVAATWAVTHATGLRQGNQLVKVHEPLMRFVAGSVSARGALEDVRSAAEPSADLTAFQAKYDSHDASIANLLQAEWLYHRGGPWDEPGLLYKMTWDLNDLLVHHARWEKRAEALECPASSTVPFLSEATMRLQERMQSQRMLANVIGEQFEGYDLNEQASQPVSDAAVMKTLAVVLGGLALLGGAAVFFTWRKRSWHPIDGLVAITAIVLVNLAGWLALGAGADQERLRASLFAQVATVYRETLDLTNGLKTLTLTPRGGVLQPRDSSEKILTDYSDYVNSLNGLAQLVRAWDRVVLTGTLDTGLISSERIQTHDDLLNSVRARTLTLYRQYAQLDRRLANLGCRSEWFARDPSQSREDRLVTLPGAQ
jgi:hypothetical protein